jgi:hypothetical protein
VEEAAVDRLAKQVHAQILTHLLQLATRNARNLLIPHEAIAASAKT